jgi:hypothetical protein
LNRSQKGCSQTTRVGLAPEIPPVAHRLKTVADRRLPLVESPGEVITALRKILGQLRDQRSERAATFTVPVTLRFDKQVPPSS